MASHPKDYGAAEGESVRKRMEVARKKLERLHSLLGRNKEQQRVLDAAGEATHRLQQIERILQQIASMLRESSQLLQMPKRTIGESEAAFIKRFEAWAPDQTTLNRHRALESDLQILTEASYWFAARARTAIRMLPGLNRFEAEGVRNVRNKLLEHPEKPDSGVMMVSFGYGAKIGPVVKGIRLETQTGVFPDPGLFVNFREFASALDASVSRALVQSGQPGAGGDQAK